MVTSMKHESKYKGWVYSITQAPDTSRYMIVHVHEYLDNEDTITPLKPYEHPNGPRCREVLLGVEEVKGLPVAALVEISVSLKTMQPSTDERIKQARSTGLQETLHSAKV